MSHFSLALIDALERSSLSQTELAERIGVAFAQVNRYATGRSDLRPAMLLKILSQFSDQAAAELLRAYLLDQCPTGKAHLVDIVVKAGEVREDSPLSFPDVPESVRKTLEFIAARCHEPAIFDFLQHFGAALGIIDSARNSRASQQIVYPADQIAAAERARRAQAKRSSHTQSA